MKMNRFLIRTYIIAVLISLTVTPVFIGLGVFNGEILKTVGWIILYTLVWIVVVSDKTLQKAIVHEYLGLVLLLETLKTKRK